MPEQVSATQRAPEPKNGLKIVKFETLVDRVESVFKDIERRAYQIFEGNGRKNGHDVDDWLKAERELLVPLKIEMNQTDKVIEMKMDVPGFNEKELEISVEPTQVTITGKRQSSKEEKKGGMFYSEAMASDLLRVVALPPEVDAAKASAELKNGVLSITIPKAANTQTIRVQSTSA